MHMITALSKDRPPWPMCRQTGGGNDFRASAASQGAMPPARSVHLPASFSKNDVDLVAEMCPSFGRGFIRRALASMNGQVQQLVDMLMDGEVPSDLEGIDWGLQDEAPEEVEDNSGWEYVPLGGDGSRSCRQANLMHNGPSRHDIPHGTSADGSSEAGVAQPSFVSPLRMPGVARADFNGAAYGPDYLSFALGESIMLLRRHEEDGGWALGSCTGSAATDSAPMTVKEGWFPAEYWALAPPAGGLTGTAIGSFDSSSYGPEYLSLECGEHVVLLWCDRNDDRWGFGTRQADGVEGWFPASHWMPLEEQSKVVLDETRKEATGHCQLEQQADAEVREEPQEQDEAEDQGSNVWKDLPEEEQGEEPQASEDELSDDIEFVCDLAQALPESSLSDLEREHAAVMGRLPGRPHLLAALRRIGDPRARGRRVPARSAQSREQALSSLLENHQAARAGASSALQASNGKQRRKKKRKEQLDEALLRLCERPLKEDVVVRPSPSAVLGRAAASERPKPQKTKPGKTNKKRKNRARNSSSPSHGAAEAAVDSSKEKSFVETCELPECLNRVWNVAADAGSEEADEFPNPLPCLCRRHALELKRLQERLAKKGRDIPNARCSALHVLASPLCAEWHDLFADVAKLGLLVEYLVELGMDINADAGNGISTPLIEAMRMIQRPMRIDPKTGVPIDVGHCKGAAAKFANYENLASVLLERGATPPNMFHHADGGGLGAQWDPLRMPPRPSGGGGFNPWDALHTSPSSGGDRAVNAWTDPIIESVENSGDSDSEVSTGSSMPGLVDVPDRMSHVDGLVEVD